MEARSGKVGLFLCLNFFLMTDVLFMIGQQGL